MEKKREFNSSIYLLPNLLTTSSLFAAFYSLISSLKGNYEASVIAILIGLLADGLDGRIARLTKTQSVFGAEYDSLSDMVTFGVAPGVLLYSSCLYQLGKVGWLIAFIFTAAVALRLARFNTQIEHEDKKYFQGLACPAGAGVISTFIWFFYIPDSFIFAVLTSLLALLLSILMVSNIRYYSFKQVDKKGRVPFLYVLLTVSLFVAVALHPAFVLLLIGVIYALSGPLQTLIVLQRVNAKRRKDKKLRANK